IYQPAPNFISSIPLMPEWYLVILNLAFLSLLGISWAPLLWLLPVLTLAIVVVFIQAGISAAKSLSVKKFNSFLQYSKYWSLTTALHIIQPIARLYGRISHGLTPWRIRGSGLYGFAFLIKRKFSHSYWSEKWKSSEEWLREIEYNLHQLRARVRRGGNYDKWDLQVSCGFFSSVRGLLTIEEHGSGKQLLRFNCHTHYSKTGMVLSGLFTVLAVIAIMASSYVAGSIMGFIALIFSVAYFTGRARAMCDLSKAFSLLSIVNEDTTPVKATEKINQNKVEEKEEPISISVFLLKKGGSERNNWHQKDIRQKRVLESAFESNSH
ncbi:MAG TPA: hypothetical protein VFO37_07420, partial [Chitinophagaceae bacterium]|nr:hypothetical protein [Chitinophagaceae bacterium]